MKNKKAHQETEITMDMILKMTPEVFRDVMKSQTQGFKQSLLNLLKSQFEQCNLAKESIATVLAKGNVPEADTKEYEKALNDLYICMQLIEDRHTILDILVKEGASIH